MNQATLSTMGRDQLVATAEDYDIEHAGLDDDQLRQAILDAENSIDTSAEDARDNDIVTHITEYPKSGLDGSCPHCGRTTHDGSKHRVTEFSELSPGSQRDTDHQYTCNACAGEWGPLVDKPKKARAPSGTSNGLKIEKDREERNGVKRPSAGGKCRGVWDTLDMLHELHKRMPTAAEARTASSFDRTTTMVQYYRWRKFMGFEGRQ